MSLLVLAMKLSSVPRESFPACIMETLSGSRLSFSLVELMCLISWVNFSYVYSDPGNSSVSSAASWMIFSSSSSCSL